MKKVLILLIVLILIDCQEDLPTVHKSPEFGEPFELKIGESVTMDEGKLNIKFDYVSIDTRCPQGSNCTDSVDAIVVLTISGYSYSLHTNLWLCGITVGTYQVDLLSLNRYPRIS